MIRFLADENLKGSIVSGLQRRNPHLDIVRAQDVGLTGASDEALLEWAARQKRILLTHDIRTVTRAAYRRLERGATLSGVLLVRDGLPALAVIEELLLIAECSAQAEWEGAVDYLPI